MSRLELTPDIVSNWFHMEQLDSRIVTSSPPYMAGAFKYDRVFGGLAVSQSFNAFKRLFPHLSPHKINYKFVAPGNVTIPLSFSVDRFDGVASVIVTQNGKIVGLSHIRYSESDDLLDGGAALPPPYVGSPDDYPSLQQLLKILGDSAPNYIKVMLELAFEVRPVESPLFPVEDHSTARFILWLRLKPELAGNIERDNGKAAALFLSDMAILQAAAEIYDIHNIKVASGASLHHTVWLHHSTDIDPRGWFLFHVECSLISYGRPRLEAYIYNERKECIISVIQEGYIQANLHAQEVKPVLQAKL